MSWTSAMWVMLAAPPKRTSGFYREKTEKGRVAGEAHDAIDFNFRDSDMNKHGVYPFVYSPVSGTVDSAAGKYNGIMIRQKSDDTYHQFLHLFERAAAIRPGVEIVAGQTLGRMGGYGPRGPLHYE